MKLLSAVNVSQHHVADAFWEAWQRNGETHKHGYYESTWIALRAALDAVQVSSPGLRVIDTNAKD